MGYLNCMKAGILLLYLLFSSLHSLAQESCVPVRMPVISDSVRKVFEEKLDKARIDYEKDTTNADAIIWFGRRLAYLGRYEEAIRIFSRGLVHHPTDARLLRHRGHRWITLRCFDAAISDLERAADLIRGLPDETEPDGLPNTLNQPTSTLQSNIWYHLGLAHYLKGNNPKAIQAYRQGLEVSKSPDMYVAMVNWLFITLKKQNAGKKAGELLMAVYPEMKLMESGDYLKILLLHKMQGGSIPNDDPNSLSSSTYGYGYGMYQLLNGKKAEAKAIFEKLVAGNQWSSFGYIAAEQELIKLR
jgi:tetratricopeptide (TPR) repeat protein